MKTLPSQRTMGPPRAQPRASWLPCPRAPCPSEALGPTAGLQALKRLCAGRHVPSAPLGWPKRGRQDASSRGGPVPSLPPPPRGSRPREGAVCLGSGRPGRKDRTSPPAKGAGAAGPVRSPTSRWGPADSFPFPWEAGRRPAGSRPGRVRCPVGLVCPSVVEPLGGGALPLLAGAGPCAGARPLFPSAKGGPDGAKFSHRQPLPARLLLPLLPELPGEGLPGCRAQKRMGLPREREREGGGGLRCASGGSFAPEVLHLHRQAVWAASASGSSTFPSAVPGGWRVLSPPRPRQPEPLRPTDCPPLGGQRHPPLSRRLDAQSGQPPFLPASTEVQAEKGLRCKSPRSPSRGRKAELSWQGGGVFAPLPPQAQQSPWALQDRGHCWYETGEGT